MWHPAAGPQPTPSDYSRGTPRRGRDDDATAARRRDKTHRSRASSRRCAPCAKAYAKRQKRPYLRSREEESLRDAWRGFVRGVRDDDANDFEDEALRVEPGNDQTAKLWAWLSQVLVSKELVEVAKARFRVTSVAPKGDLDLQSKSFSIELAVTCVRRADILPTGRGGAAARTWIFREGKGRRAAPAASPRLA